MPSDNVNPKISNEPALRLLLSDTFEPLWKSLFHGLNEVFFPKKLSALRLESKPIPVKDIWGFYNYKKNGVLASGVAHVLVLGVVIGITFIRVSRPVSPALKPQIDTQLIDPDNYSWKSAGTKAGGGGGGGDRDVLQASVGRLPKSAMQQLAPPA
ncbi:MAG TPA: hypothetical protein VMU26_25585, partial [Candidatus Polarisedimenticolia bacterium]|nr:hypothetical protein [Candidatus Polarisedimenticolia bacterium]